MRNGKLSQAVVLALITLSVRSANAQTPILSFVEATGSSGTNQAQNVGWRFNILAPITVTGLGWYDQNRDGLSNSHTVGIWNSSGTLLTSVLVDAGTTDPLVGEFRTHSVAPITLSAGTGYIVGGENFANSTDRLSFNVTQTLNSNITYDHATFSNLGTGLVIPTLNSAAITGFYGPSFSISASGVPEPSSLAFLATSVMVGGGFLLRRRRSVRRAD